MTDEVLCLLKKAEEAYENKSRHTLEYVQEAIAVIEANPPLVEVEGQLVLGGDGNYRMGVCFRAEDVFVLDSTNPIPVTVTIRGRGDVPEPPAISSSIR